VAGHDHPLNVGGALPQPLDPQVAEPPLERQFPRKCGRWEGDSVPGTLYRRFPTKDALISALVHDVLSTMLKIAQEGTERPDGTGLEYFLEGASAYQAAHRGCLPRLWNDGIEHDLVQEVRRLIDALLTDAKRHGRIRPTSRTPT
jgi:hypothetical protein